ncbi:MAG: ABC transporter ATP-binding protein [Candidatus Omnitrophica bacterium]|nr:ABC transporter ATP-binding protein [Candidatus Omnitrophota bacterium]MCM8791366.1 ABC transporter ATP-binding protein [Candidatus Omnitrophota bacterium]
MANILSVKGLYGGYGSQMVVRGVSFEVGRGEFLGIIGPNGSGKSTLLRLATRILKPSAGSVMLDGKNIRSIDSKAFFRRVAFVSQDTIIQFPFTARQIVLMGRIPHLKRLQFETRRDLEIADRALALTDTSHLAERPIDSLSAGERQRVIIAKALAQEPELLFLDEPTSHLDIGHQARTLDLLKKLNMEKNLTIVMVLHDLNLASAYCDRLIMLNDGVIYREGCPDEVLTYQNIEAIYHTVVLVNKSRITSRPNIVVVPGGVAFTKEKRVNNG